MKRNLRKHNIITCTFNPAVYRHNRIKNIINRQNNWLITFISCSRKHDNIALLRILIIYKSVNIILLSTRYDNRILIRENILVSRCQCIINFRLLKKVNPRIMREEEINKRKLLSRNNRSKHINNPPV